MLHKKIINLRKKRETNDKVMPAKALNPKADFIIKTQEDQRNIKFTSGKSSLKTLKSQQTIKKKKIIMHQPCFGVRKNSIECGKILERVLKKKEKFESVRNAIVRRRSLEMISLSPINNAKDTSMFDTSLEIII